ncbi:hypothetical protein C3B44_07875 [Corynebacterium yudongzhengii]|uniref:Uncharacterized protein n=1 Tax=Corynebacterium yudongzhengii TaxID=2080740 RepID=A0A2U1T7X3_9CORY|nr:DUF6882 domain-containing protein [Corynebacterium yudongzhengii]AWB82280.1 hypothetical protein C3B44_07875 [Corynebacterium yudongzhengii]PWC02101.1 hypothetical protein DF222_04505 [Corynebacterium yudongzhengii]
MQLPSPRSLAEVVADGTIEQAAIDAASPRIKHLECNGLAPLSDEKDAACEIRLDPARRTLTATRVARISDGTWTWLTQRIEGFDLPEFRGPIPASDELIDAARTLFGNAPAFVIPHDEATASVVIPHGRPETLPTREALATGLPRVPSAHLRRAIDSFAATRGLGVRHGEEAIDFSDGTRLGLHDGLVTDIYGLGGPRFSEIRADAFFPSVEHQLLLDGRFPHHTLVCDLASGRARLATAAGEMELKAHVMGFIEADQWRWAWADPRTGGHESAALSLRVRAFGQDKGLPVLQSPRLSWHKWLIELCKPITGRFTHGFVHLGDSVAVVLLEHDSLRLPPPSESALRATLARELPAGVDPQRAVARYCDYRGLALHEGSLHAPDTGRTLRILIEGRKVSVDTDGTR